MNDLAVDTLFVLLLFASLIALIPIGVTIAMYTTRSVEWRENRVIKLFPIALIVWLIVTIVAILGVSS